MISSSWSTSMASSPSTVSTPELAPPSTSERCERKVTSSSSSSSSVSSPFAWPDLFASTSAFTSCDTEDADDVTDSPASDADSCLDGVVAPPDSAAETSLEGVLAPSTDNEEIDDDDATDPARSEAESSLEGVVVSSLDGVIAPSTDNEDGDASAGVSDSPPGVWSASIKSTDCTSSTDALSVASDF